MRKNRDRPFLVVRIQNLQYWSNQKNPRIMMIIWTNSRKLQKNSKTGFTHFYIKHSYSGNPIRLQKFSILERSEGQLKKYLQVRPSLAHCNGFLKSSIMLSPTLLKMGFHFSSLNLDFFLFQKIWSHNIHKTTNRRYLNSKSF